MIKYWLTTTILFVSLLSFSQAPIIQIEAGGHFAKINNLLLGPSGEELISVSDDKTIRVWDLNDGSLQRTHRGEIGSGQKGMLKSAAIHPRSMIITGGITGEQGNRSIRVLNMFTGEVVRTFTGINGEIQSVSVSPNGRLIAVGSTDQQLNVFAYDGSSSFTLKSHNTGISAVSFSPDNKKLVSADQNGNVVIWDLYAYASGKPDYYSKFPGHQGRINAIQFDPDGSHFITGGTDNKLLRWNVEDGMQMELAAVSDPAFGDDANWGDIFDMDISPDGTKLLVATKISDGKSTLLFDAETGTQLKSFNGMRTGASAVCFLDNERFAFAGGRHEIQVWTIRDMKMERKFISKGLEITGLGGDETGRIAIGVKGSEVYSRVFDPNTMDLKICSDPGKYNGIYKRMSGVSFTVSDRMVKISNGTTVEIPEGSGKINASTFLKDGRLALGTDQALLLYDVDGNLVMNCRGHIGGVTGLTVSGNFLVSAGRDQMIYYWDPATDMSVPEARLFLTSDYDWVMWTPEGDYSASLLGGNFAGYHINNGEDTAASFRTLDQFDLVHHRPDRVMLYLEIQNDELIRANVKTWLKKLENYNLKSGTLQKSMNAPSFNLISPPREVNQESITLNFNIDRGEAELDRIHVLVNDVPIHGKYGFPAMMGGGVQVNSTSLILNPGENKIQLYVQDKNGIKSNRETAYIHYEPLVTIKRPTLYFYAIGVSDYKNKEMDVNNAEGDARALTNIFSRMKHLYHDIKINVITNEEVSFTRIPEMRSQLEITEARDIVIVYVAGQALLDEEFNYYLATYNTDFADPGRGGLAFSVIEDILDGIPSRNKLVLVNGNNPSPAKGKKTLVDAVDGGDLYKQPFAEGTLVNNGISFNTGVEMLKKHFTELSRTSGATVISTTAAADLFVEGDQYNNGLFAWAIIEGLTTRKADINHDGTILVSELRQYVYEMSIELAGDTVSPTSTAEILENDFVIWR